MRSGADQALAAQSQRLKGVALVSASAIVFSTFGLFVKGVDADSWSILFWRGITGSLFTVGYVCWRGDYAKQLFKLGKSGWAVGIVGGLATMAYIPAYKFTTVANVSLIYAAAPLFAAGVAWLWMRERPRRRTIMAGLAAIVGVGIIVSQSVGGINLKGDLLALLMTLGLAIYMTIYRRYPETSATGPNILSALIILPISLVMTNPFGISTHDLWITIAFGLMFAFCSVTMAAGARLLPSSEAALLGALETPLAPVWAWLLLNELPGVFTLIGGGIILVAIIYSQLGYDS